MVGSGVLVDVVVGVAVAVAVGVDVGTDRRFWKVTAVHWSPGTTTISTDGGTTGVQPGCNTSDTT